MVTFANRDKLGNTDKLAEILGTEKKKKKKIIIKKSK